MSNVRISEDAHSVLRSIAEVEGLSMQVILDQAVDAYRRSRFWEQVESASLDLRKDPGNWDEELAERRVWEATLSDSLDDD